MSNRLESKVEFLKLVAQQCPFRVGVLTLQTGSPKFAKINFDPKDAALQNFIDQGLKFIDSPVVLPCKALDSSMKVVRLRLSNFPFLSESELFNDL